IMLCQLTCGCVEHLSRWLVCTNLCPRFANFVSVTDGTAPYANPCAASAPVALIASFRPINGRASALGTNGVRYGTQEQFFARCLEAIVFSTGRPRPSDEHTGRNKLPQTRRSPLIAQ
ncbi:hypothetical protein PQR53_30275, partial [Paraburkholderia fungorum]|uniref:hypothetical protein n=1 Tax=Paraburkholderia fungorum TaxID=134537 RepID=UPI0038BDBCC8